jgi:hypothetical protein
MPSWEMKWKARARIGATPASVGATNGTTKFRTRVTHPSCELMAAKSRSVRCRIFCPIGQRSLWYVSRSAVGARPAITSASFQARFAASWRPVFMPCPPAGLWMWAASPATNTRPSP